MKISAKGYFYSLFLCHRHIKKFDKSVKKCGLRPLEYKFWGGRSRKPINIKQMMDDRLREVASAPGSYVYDPQKNLSRTRKWPLYTVIQMLIGMSGNRLGKELLDWFGYSQETASTSAFVPQRNKMKPDTGNYIFHTMISRCHEHTFYNGYRWLAIDGSDVRLPSDKKERFSYIRIDEITKGYHRLHLDAW